MQLGLAQSIENGETKDGFLEETILPQDCNTCQLLFDFFLI
jgi:hypothetical protein